MSDHHQLSLNSYDRLFSNQDTLPKGGFGNLIALPLQGQSRKKGNTVFMNDDFMPYLNQWKFLSFIKKLTLQEVTNLMEILAVGEDIIDVRKSIMDEDADIDPWLVKTKKVERFPRINELLPNSIELTFANLIYVESM